MALDTFPICPYCGHIERDAWEIDFGSGLDGDTENTCGNCGEEYFLSREVRVYYTSEKRSGIAKRRISTLGKGPEND